MKLTSEEKKKYVVKWEQRQIRVEETHCVITIDEPNGCSPIERTELIKNEIDNSSYYHNIIEYLDFEGDNLKEPAFQILSIEDYVEKPKKEPLKIFHICRKEEAGFDEVQDFVIVATSTDEAFLIARRNKGDEALLEWSIVNELGPYAGDEKEPHVVCRNHNNA
jgi:hypothetical protein